MQCFRRATYRKYIFEMARARAIARFSYPGLFMGVFHVF